MDSKPNKISTYFWALILEKYYVYNIFTTLSQKILNGRLLLIVMGRQKCNLSCEFKLKPITTFFFWEKKPITTYHALLIYWKNIMDLPLLVFLASTALFFPFHRYPCDHDTC